ncbi:hypothetical protein FRB90_001198 [Tulasnella sp. 427]|nr:hypothetical protein FRB90_001198 [Tulasnella sp. 427]
MIAAASIDPSRLIPPPRAPSPSSSGSSHRSESSARPASPPPYTAPDPFDVGILPAYTATRRADEFSIQNQPASSSAVARGSSDSSLEYVYSTKNMTLNLGRRVNGTDCPSYGRNGIISGVLTVHSFKHAKEVSITIWGRATIVVTDRGFPVLHDRRLVLFHTISLWELSKDSPRPKGPQTYAISFPIPTYSRGRSTPLPPTMSTTTPSIELEVRYSIVIDMYKQGFHRHECTNTPFYYLPRSTPTSLRRLTAAFEEVEDKTDEGDGLEWRMMEATPRGRSGDSSPILQFGLPLPLSYASGMAIPFRLTLISLENELTEADFRSAFAVRLVRSTFLTIAKQRVRIERVLATGEIWKVEQTEKDGTRMWEVTGSLVGVKPGGETSWGLVGFLEVRYAIRMTFDSVAGLPSYTCEEVVQLVTDEATEEFDLDDARERPALGLIDQQRGLAAETIPIQLNALKASAAFLATTDKDGKSRGAGLVAPMLNTLPPLPKEFQDAFLQALLPLTSTDPQLFRPHLTSLVTFLPTLISRPPSQTPTGFDDVEDDPTRYAALEMLVSLTENDSKVVQSCPEWTPSLVRCCLEGLAEIHDDTDGDWADRDPNAEGDEDGYPTAFEQALDRSAVARCPMLGSRSKSPELVVFWVVLDIESQLQEVLQLGYANVIMPALIKALNAPEPRVHTYAGAALVNFCHGAPEEAVGPYLQGIVRAILQILKTSKMPYEQHQAFTTLAMVADAARTSFLPFYPSIFGMAKDVLRKAGAKSQRMLRCRVMECAALVGCAVGKKTFKRDAPEFMGLLFEIGDSVRSDPDVDHETVNYLLSTYSKVASTLGQSFAPYLPRVMPEILSAAAIKQEMKEYSDDEEEKDEKGDYINLVVDGRRVGIKTAILEDKAQAFDHLVVISSSLKDGYAEWTKPTLEICLPGLKFFWHEGVRESSAMLIPMLIACGKSVLTAADLQTIFRTLLAAINDEADTGYLASLYKSVVDSTLVLPSKGLPPDLANDVVASIQRKLQSMAAKRKRRADYLMAHAAENMEEEREGMALEEELEDFVLDEMGRLLHLLDPNHPYLIMVGSVRELGVTPSEAGM